MPYHFPSATGVTFPSGEAQEELIRSLYQPAGLSPESLEYIEAHGTGTKVKALPGPVTPLPLSEGLPAAVLPCSVPRRWVTLRN